MQLETQLATKGSAELFAPIEVNLTSSWNFDNILYFFFRVLAITSKLVQLVEQTTSEYCRVGKSAERTPVVVWTAQ